MMIHEHLDCDLALCRKRKNKCTLEAILNRRDGKHRDSARVSSPCADGFFFCSQSICNDAMKCFFLIEFVNFFSPNKSLFDSRIVPY